MELRASSGKRSLRKRESRMKILHDALTLLFHKKQRKKIFFILCTVARCLSSYTKLRIQFSHLRKLFLFFSRSDIWPSFCSTCIIHRRRRFDPHIQNFAPEKRRKIAICLCFSPYTLQMNHKNRALCKSLKRTFPSLPFPLLLPLFFAQIFVLAESRFLLPSSSPSLFPLLYTRKCRVLAAARDARPLTSLSLLSIQSTLLLLLLLQVCVLLRTSGGLEKEREREREICWGKTRWKEQERRRRRENVFFLAEKIREYERHTVFLYVLCAYDVQLRFARFYYFFRPGLFKLGFKFRGARGIRFLLPNTSLGN